MSKPKHRLSKLRFRFVSFVNQGDNPGATVEILKVAPPGNQSATSLPGSGGHDGPTSSQRGEPIMGDTEQKLDEVQMDLPADWPEEARDYVTKVEQFAAELEAERDELRKAVAAAEDTDEPATEEERLAKVLKGADPAVVALFKAQADELAEVRKIAAAEAEARQAEVIAKRVSQLSSLPATEAELTTILKADIGDEARQLLDELLTKFNAAMGDSAIFAEIGKAGDVGSTNDFETMVQTVLKGAAETGNPITYEQAVARTLESRPDLYESATNAGGN